MGQVAVYPALDRKKAPERDCPFGAFRCKVPLIVILKGITLVSTKVGLSQPAARFPASDALFE
jgi:hypothetical protein